MLEDFETCTNTPIFSADVCIIGAGAAGITLARVLADAGYQVCLLESGGTDYESPTQDLAHGESVGFPYYPLRKSRLRFFGGTTTIWGGRCAQLDASDFERKPWVTHSGWPFGKDTLAPFYARAQRQLGLEAMDLGDETWTRHGLHDAPFDPQVLRTSFWQFDGQTDRFTMQQCDDLIASSKVRILLHATVVDIHANADGTAIKKLDIANLRGGRGEVRARTYVLAAGGIENARLLLASRGVNPNGLGNQHDLVGRFFMEHPHARGGRIITSDVWQVLKMLPRSYQRAGQRYAVLARASEALQEREGTLNTSFIVSVRQHQHERMALGQSLYRNMRHTLTANRRNRLLWHVKRRLALWQREKLGTMIDWLRVTRGRYGLYTVIRAEQAPNPDSRVTLTSEKDALGVPRIALDWRLSEIDKHSVRVVMAALDGEVRRIGFGHVEPSAWLDDDGPIWETDPLISSHPVAGYHHMGTTRMAASPREGVVDADCRVHDIGNLYIAGSSVFPTCGWANPTLTIIAMTLKLADHLKTALITSLK